jgi:hypothetical protein
VHPSLSLHCLHVDRANARTPQDIRLDDQDAHRSRRFPVHQDVDLTLYHPTSSHGFYAGTARSPPGVTPTFSMSALTSIAGMSKRTGFAILSNVGVHVDAELVV